MQYSISAFSDMISDMESKLGLSTRTLYIALFAAALVALAAVVAAVVLGVKCRNRAKALAELYDEIDLLLGEEEHTAEREEANAYGEQPAEEKSAEERTYEDRSQDERRKELRETAESLVAERETEDGSPAEQDADDELTMALEEMTEDIQTAEAEVEEAVERDSEAEAQNPAYADPEPTDPETQIAEYADPEPRAKEGETVGVPEKDAGYARPVAEDRETQHEHVTTYEPAQKPKAEEENVPEKEMPVTEETHTEENAVTDRVSSQELNTVTEEPAMQEAAPVAVREEKTVSETIRPSVHEDLRPTARQISEQSSHAVRPLDSALAESKSAERKPVPERKRAVKKADRLNVSFRGKVIQSPREVQILCGEITDELTAYAGVEAAENWRKICFKSGKETVANLFYNSTVLTLTLAVDPAECAGLYGIIDATDIKRYAGTPTAIEIKSDRDKFTAVKAIAHMMKNSGTVKRNVTRSRDYVTEYKTDEELVELGLAR